MKYKAGDVVWSCGEKWKARQFITNLSGDYYVLSNKVSFTLPVHKSKLKPVVRCYAVLS